MVCNILRCYLLWWMFQQAMVRLERHILMHLSCAFLSLSPSLPHYFLLFIPHFFCNAFSHFLTSLSRHTSLPQVADLPMRHAVSRITSVDFGHLFALKRAVNDWNAVL